MRIYSDIRIQPHKNNIYLTIGENHDGNIKQYPITLFNCEDIEFGKYIGHKK